MAARHKTVKGPWVLAGDIGGTKTRLALYGLRGRSPVLRSIRTYPSREARGLGELVHRFLREHPGRIEAACFGVAGPVIREVSRTTNLPWRVCRARIQRRFGWSKVVLINDLEALAWSIPRLRRGQWVPLNKARGRKGHPVAIVAPGTGVGLCLAIPWGTGFKILPSEGGHADFSPANEDQAGLWHYLRRRFGHVSVERVVSGPGLVNIYGFLKKTRGYQEPEWLAKKVSEGDPAAAISRAALEEREPLCVRSLQLFAEALAGAAGNLALTGLTLGGVYLGGGIPPKILPFLKTAAFLRAFADKGRFRGLLEGIPLRVVLEEKASLLGAALRAFEDLERERQGVFVARKAPSMVE